MYIIHFRTSLRPRLYLKDNGQFSLCTRLHYKGHCGRWSRHLNVWTHSLVSTLLAWESSVVVYATFKLAIGCLAILPVKAGHWPDNALRRPPGTTTAFWTVRLTVDRGWAPHEAWLRLRAGPARMGRPLRHGSWPIRTRWPEEWPPRTRRTACWTVCQQNNFN